jgi:hypothetical protein
LRTIPDLIKNKIKKNELVSLLPFTNGETIDSIEQFKETIHLSEKKINENEFQFFNKNENLIKKKKDKKKNNQFYSFILDEYFEREKQIYESGQQLKYFNDLSYTICYSHFKLLNQSFNDSLYTPLVTETEMNYEFNKDRLSYYKNNSSFSSQFNNNDNNNSNYLNNNDNDDEISDSNNKKSNENDNNNNIDIDIGDDGGECELLILSPNYELEKEMNNNNNVNDYKNLFNKKYLEYIEEENIGWMNLNDIIGSGIQTYEPYKEIEPNQIKKRNSIWLKFNENLSNSPSSSSNENNKNNADNNNNNNNEFTNNDKCGLFEYFPGEPLSWNKEKFKSKNEKLGNSKNLTQPLMNNFNKHHVRDPIPIYDLQFLFLSLLPNKN